MKEVTRMLAASAMLLAACAGQGAVAANCATNAVPRSIEYPWMSVARWHQMYNDQLTRAIEGDIDLMFVGDSITEMWPKPVWDANFSRFKPANFGIGGDNTGNLLWRLQHPAMASLKPKLVVLLIGVNNLNLCQESPEQVFAGIQAVLAKLRTQYPRARILLNAVLPTGEAPDSAGRQKVNDLNKMVVTLGDGKTVFFHDYGPLFIGAGGKLSAELQPDFLHFSEKGYRIWGEAIRPDIEALLK
jgi:lysophospholipase L1-like esterase